MMQLCKTAQVIQWSRQIVRTIIQLLYVLQSNTPILFLPNEIYSQYPDGCFEALGCGIDVE